MTLAITNDRTVLKTCLYIQSRIFRLNCTSVQYDPSQSKLVIDPFTNNSLEYMTRGWSPKFAIGLNIIIGIVQKYKSDQAVLLPKRSSSFWQKNSLGQPGNSYIFWSMPIITFSPVTNFADHPLIFQKISVVIFKYLFQTTVVAKHLRGDFLELFYKN